MEKLIASVIGVVIWGLTFSFLSYHIHRAKQKFAYGIDDWFFISLICLTAFILGALFIFGS